MDKIVITTTSFGKYEKKPLKLLEDKGFQISLNPYGRKLGKAEVLEICKDAVGIISGTEIIDRDLIQQLTKLRAISRCGIGMDNIDSKSAKEFGIKVFNTPDAPTLAVAELTIGLILSVLRRIAQADSNIRSGNWEKYMGNLLHGKKVGIIGLGRIGKKVALLVAPFEVEVLCCEPNPDESFIREHKIRNMPLHNLLSDSDIVTLHLTPQQEGYFIGASELGLMKKDSFLINTSRGNLIDEKALIDALRDKKICGAGLDVYEKEPYNGLLKKLDNVVLTAHMGSYAKESRVRMEIEAAENLIKGLGL